MTQPPLAGKQKMFIPTLTEVVLLSDSTPAFPELTELPDLPVALGALDDQATALVLPSPLGLSVSDPPVGIATAGPTQGLFSSEATGEIDWAAGLEKAWAQVAPDLNTVIHDEVMALLQRERVALLESIQARARPLLIHALKQQFAKEVHDGPVQADLA